jgi:hypothetical protein
MSRSCALWYTCSRNGSGIFRCRETDKGVGQKKSGNVVRCAEVDTFRLRQPTTDVEEQSHHLSNCTIIIFAHAQDRCSI